MHLCRLYLHVISLLTICPLLLLASVSTPLKSRVIPEDKSNILENKGTQKYDIKSDSPVGKFTPRMSERDITSNLEGTIWPSLTSTQNLRREIVPKDAPRKSPLVEYLSYPKNNFRDDSSENEEKSAKQRDTAPRKMQDSDLGNVSVNVMTTGTPEILLTEEYTSHTHVGTGRSVISQDVPGFPAVSLTTEHEEKESPSSSFLWHEKLRSSDEAGAEKEENVESGDETDQSETCSTCGKEDTTDEEAKSLRIEMFKQTLIKELDLDPNDLHINESDRKTPSFDINKLPPLLMDHMQQDAPVYDNFNAETLAITIPGMYMGHECIRRHATGCATFDLRDKIKGDISGAELWLYKMEDGNDIARQTLDVYELSKTSGNPLRMKSLVSRTEFFVKEGWLNMDLTGTIRQWLEESRNSPVLAFSCTTCKTRSYKALYGIKSDYKPLLVVKFARKYLKRDKRSEPECNPNQSCCKSPLVVNFFDIGMTKILQPRTVNIGYCHGSCSRRDQYNTNHTAVIQHLRGNYPTRYSYLASCCVPTGRLKALTIMEMKNGDGAISKLHNVIVNQCGCA